MSATTTPARQANAAGLWREVPDAVAARLRPVIERAGEDAAGREQRHELPHAPLRAILDAGFGSLRVPVEAGGAGLSWRQLIAVLVEIAAADANLAQITRGHLAFVEDRLVSPLSADRDRWFARFVAGEFVGNAWTEPGPAVLGRSGTTVTRVGDGYTLSGRKFYTTGSIYADWVDVTARLAEAGPDIPASIAEVTVLVRAAQPGVTIIDDWDGFGQQLTGTGTAVFDRARVDAGELRRFDDRFRYQNALYQLVLLATLAGIGRAAERDAAAQLRARSRVYSHGTTSLASEDPQLLAAIGEVAAAAAVAEAAVISAAEAIDRAAETAADRDSGEHREAVLAAELRTAQAQIVLSRSIPEAATRVFDALGASAVRRGAGLDRHWRNARTVASHNPYLYKARIVGDHSVNGTEPPTTWAIGVAPTDAATDQKGSR